MYYSVVVGLLVKAWKFLVNGYDNSLLKKICYPVMKGIKNLSKGSLIIRLFTSNRSLIEESLLYRLYTIIVDIANRIIDGLKKVVKKGSQGSLIYTSFYKLFEDEIQLQNTLYVFLMAFGIGIIANNLVRGYYQGRSYLVSIALIIISVIGLNIKEDYKKVLEGSFAFRIVRSIFTIDEGVDQWW